MVFVNEIDINGVIPFYNPSNNPAPTFIHNASTRKSFSKGNQKLRLCVAGSKPARVAEENEDNKSPSCDGNSSPNLSLELVDEIPIFVTRPEESNSYLPAVPSMATHPSAAQNGYTNGNGNMHSFYGKAADANASTTLNFPSMASSTGYSSLGINPMGYEDGPSSLKSAGEIDRYHFESLAANYNNDLEYSLNETIVPIITNFDQHEMVEDFRVNQNIHPNIGPTSLGYNYTANSNNQQHTNKANKPKTSTTLRRSTLTNNLIGKTSTSSSTYQQRHSRFSASTTDLHKLDDNMLLQKSNSTQHMVKGAKRSMDTQQNSNLNKENTRNKNINVQIFAKPLPPARSKTSLDLRTSTQNSQRQSNVSFYTIIFYCNL